MANRYKVTLTQKEREVLTELTRSGKSTAARFVHARVLLLCDAGKFGDPWKVADVAAALGVRSKDNGSGEPRQDFRNEAPGFPVTLVSGSIFTPAQ